MIQHKPISGNFSGGGLKCSRLTLHKTITNHKYHEILFLKSLTLFKYSVHCYLLKFSIEALQSILVMKENILHVLIFHVCTRYWEWLLDV